MTQPLPGPTGAFGNIAFARRFSRDPISAFRELARYDSDLLHYQLGPFNTYMPKHPDLIHEILVTKAKSFHKWERQKQVFGKFNGNGLVNSDGDFWRRQRKLVQPAFHHKRIRTYAEIMVEYTGRHMATWRTGAPLNIEAALSALTRDIVTKTLFDADVSDESQRLSEIIALIQVMAFRQFGELLALPEWLPTPNKRRERAALADLDTIVHGLIRERRASGIDKGDLLSMLLLAVEDGEGMTDQQARNEITTLFIAGHETTSTALAWVVYLVAAHPAVEAKLLAEVDALGGRAPTFDDLPRLKYTEWVIKESMRLYPPTYFFPREVVEPVEIGGHMLPKGALIQISPYMLHHDPRFWEQSETFMPERFAPDRIASVPDYAYFPFGAGPRVCIGNAFAMMEMQLIVATIMAQMRLPLTPGHAKPELLPLITLLPA
ncbi:MAG: cytochrome P450 [Chloroflexota bacterium]|nr:cytochrome P450 [Chloroflexota bacterium]